MAVWTIIYDGAGSTSQTLHNAGEIFSVPTAGSNWNSDQNTAIETAEYYLDNRGDSTTWLGQMAEMQGSAQDQIVVTNASVTPTTSVPLPAAVWGGFVLLSGMAGKKWMKGKRQTPSD